jgi:hypothetical protein
LTIFIRKFWPKLFYEIGLQGTFLGRPENYECGVRLSSGYIIGGENAKRGDYPFIAALGFDRPQGEYVQGCQIVRDTIIPKRGKITKRPENMLQMTVCNMLQIVPNYKNFTNIVHFKALQNLPTLGFLV